VIIRSVSDPKPASLPYVVPVQFQPHQAKQHDTD